MSLEQLDALLGYDYWYDVELVSKLRLQHTPFYICTLYTSSKTFVCRDMNEVGLQNVHRRYLYEVLCMERIGLNSLHFLFHSRSSSRRYKTQTEVMPLNIHQT